MPIGRGGAFGSNISRRFMVGCVVRSLASLELADAFGYLVRSLASLELADLYRELVFDGADLVEETPKESQLPKERDEGSRLARREAGAERPYDLLPARRHGCRQTSHRRQVSRLSGVRELLSPLEHLEQKLRLRPGLAPLLHLRAGELEQSLGAPQGVAHRAPRLVDLDGLLERGAPLARTRADVPVGVERARELSMHLFDDGQVDLEATSDSERCEGIHVLARRRSVELPTGRSRGGVHDLRPKTRSRSRSRSSRLGWRT